MRTMSEQEYSDARVRTAVMIKDDEIGIIGLVTSTYHSQVGRFDPRSGSPLTSRWDDSKKAKRGFRNMLRSSVENGWEIIYDGEPLVG
jgi:hypothetical protein